MTIGAHRAPRSSLDELLSVARDGEPVELGADVAARVAAGRAIVERALEGDAPVYGLTTGVGVRKRTRVEPGELAAFNRQLVLEHRVGQGEPRQSTSSARSCCSSRTDLHAAAPAFASSCSSGSSSG